MTLISRPLRALGVVLGGWTAARVIALWPIAPAGEAALVDKADVPPPMPLVAMPLDNDVPLFAKRPLSARGEHAVAKKRMLIAALQGSDGPRGAVVGVVAAHDSPTPLPKTASASQLVGDKPMVPGLPTAPSETNRWSGSAWVLMRGDGAPSLASGGQLGGSQIGMRIFYTPGPKAVALTARVSTALSPQTGREAAVGLALRGRNVGLIAEQRFALDKSGRDAPAVFAYGGVSDVNIGGGIKFDGYAQAGIVGVKHPEAFVDGALRVETAIIEAEKSSLSVGAGVWGGAQKGAARIDVGPQIVARIAVAETNLRISAEWRERIAGDAAPASGPSVTVGFDF
jgi:hypothetical protein